MKALVVGLPFSENLGDGLIFLCIEQLLAQHGVEAVACDLAGRRSWRSHSNGPGQFLGDPLAQKVKRSLFRVPHVAEAFRFIRWNSLRTGFEAEVRLAVAAVDCVIIGGGQLLTHARYGLTERITSVARIANELGKPLAILGCGAGTTLGSAASSAYSQLLRQAVHVSARGSTSASSLSRIHPLPAIQVIPDPVFSAGQVLPGHEHAIGGLIGVCFQNTATLGMHMPEIRDRGRVGCHRIIQAIIRGIERSGRAVEIFTNGDSNDHYEALEFAAEANRQGSGVSVHPRPIHPLELCHLSQRYSGVVGFRMHASIAAFAYRTPTVSVVWDSKVEEVWEAAGVPKVAVTINAIEADENLIARMLGNPVSQGEVAAVQQAVADGVAECVSQLLQACRAVPQRASAFGRG